MIPGDFRGFWVQMLFIMTTCYGPFGSAVVGGYRSWEISGFGVKEWATLDRATKNYLFSERK